MAEPKIVFNAGSGSDTQASGAGPGDGTTVGSAVFGSASAHTGGSASTVIQLPAGTVLTGVPVDGSAALYLTTASGRRFSKITAVAGSGGATPTVTVADSFTVSAPGVDWSIGGKRATLEDTGSRQLGADIKAGWWICIQDQQTLNSRWTLSVSGSTSSPGWIIVTGLSRANKPLIRGTMNDPSIYCTGVRIMARWLSFDNTHATKTASAGLHQNNTTSEFYVYECVFGDPVNKLWRGIANSATPSYRIVGCEFRYLTDRSLRASFAGSTITMHDCSIHHCQGGEALSVEGGNSSLRRCKIWANSGVGLGLISSDGASITDCVFDGNGSHGVNFTNASGLQTRQITGNHFTNNGGYGLRWSGGTPSLGSNDLALIDHNNYYGNTSGARLNAPAGAHDLAADPQFVDRAAGDFRTQNPALFGRGYPDPHTEALGYFSQELGTMRALESAAPLSGPFDCAPIGD